MLQCTLTLARPWVFRKMRARSNERNMYEKICKSCKMLDTAIGLHLAKPTSRVVTPQLMVWWFWRWPQQNIQESRSKFRKYRQKQTSGLYSTLQIRNTVEDGTFRLIEMDHISGSHRDSLSLHAYHNQRTCDAPLLCTHNMLLNTKHIGLILLVMWMWTDPDAKYSFIFI